MASLDDILTTQKNGVVAINNVSQTFLRYIGTNTTLALDVATVVATSPGRLVNICVIAGGSTTGMIYNVNSYDPLTPPLDNQRLYLVGTTEGVYPLNLLFNSGLVFVPGTDQAITLTYSLG